MEEEVMRLRHEIYISNFNNNIYITVVLFNLKTEKYNLLHRDLYTKNLTIINNRMNI